MEPATKVVMLIEVCNHYFTLIFLVSKVSTQILREPYIVHPFWVNAASSRTIEFTTQE